MTDQLNPRFRFDTYVVGAANRLAVTAARAVATSPGTAYNPLCIYAGPGLGKTHLLMAVGHAARAVNPALKVEYFTLEDFVEAFHAATAAGHGDAFRRRYAEVGLLLVDDVQSLTHRREVQAELLRLLATMQTANRQVVLTSDRPPGEIEGLDERLIQRFAGGLVIDMGPPEYETRVAILRRVAEERGGKFGEGVLEAVADVGASNVRELIGALNRLVAFQSVSDQPLDAARARQLLGGGAAPAPPAAPGDEFGSFLSEITTTVAQQVEAWRARVAEAVMRWEGEGFRTHRLEALLTQDAPVDPDQILKAFVADVERLQALEVEAGELDPGLGGSPAFRDPDNVALAAGLVARARAGTTPPPGPSPLWKLDDLVEGANNATALRAARAIVAEPGTARGPLVIVGGSGIGKTHLLHGIGNVLAAQPDAVVACLSAQNFLDDLAEARKLDRGTLWRARYRRVTALLLDDAHLLAGQTKTEEELLWLLNLLSEGHRQVILTSGAPLAEVPALHAGLRKLLTGALEVRLGPPERDLRQVVIERMLQAEFGEADAELAGYLAGRSADSVRTVQGVVQRVIAAAEADHRRPDAAMARELLEGPVVKPPKRAGMRTSGLVVSPSGGIKSPEKMVWDWPDLADRVIEDLR